MEGVDDTGHWSRRVRFLRLSVVSACLTGCTSADSVQLAGSGITVSPRCLNLLVGIATLGRTRGESSE